MGVLDSIKSKIPFLNKGGEDELSEDFGADLNLDDVPAPGAEPEPFAGDLEQPTPPAGEYQHPEPEFSHEPQPQFSPQPSYQPPSQPQYSPPSQYSPQPSYQQYPAPQQNIDLENLKLNMDNIKQRIENLIHRFDTLAAELDTIKSNAEYEKSVLSKFDYYFRDFSVKLDTLEKQHEAIWHEIKNASANPQ